MKSISRLIGMFAVMLAITAVIFPDRSLAHCDTLDGPVVAAAKKALADGDPTPLQKWVRPEEENEIKTAFQKTLTVRAKGPEARELADMYFFETLVRLHRAGEGAPYTGLKPGEAIDPAVVLADKAMETGSVDNLVKIMTNALADGIRERFAKAYESQKHADDNVAAGREFVESYITFTHYVEGLHGLIKSDAGHHGEGGGNH